MPALKKIGAACLAAFGYSSGGASAVTASYLQVAGGGGGGGTGGNNSNNGGGGGAGGLLTGTTSLNPTLSYTVIVGAGGAGAASTAYFGVNGSNSQFGSLTASVGGGFGTGTYPSGVAGSGGSGGGTYRAGTTAGTGTAGQGYAGAVGREGSGGAGSGDGYNAGGGGGAGAIGGSASGSVGGAGGVGVASSISGTSTYYAGGGGGGVDNYRAPSGSGGAGGNGGGGAGGNGSAGISATANTGGGGGGSSVTSGGTFFAGGNGGSGVVIISYAGAQQFGGGVVTTDGTNTIHTFNTSGTLSPLNSLTVNQLLLVGGGGGGGGGASGGGGGGGGGGFINLTSSAITIDTSSTYLVVVGAGGARSSSVGVSGFAGTNSTFSAYATAAVGGGRGGYSSGDGASVGGSGGGGGGNGSATGAAGTSGQGNAGGNATGSGGLAAGGGGGGAGAAGTSASGSPANGGNGGAGLTSSISGTSTYYAGGGGGGSFSAGSGSGGIGGGAQGGNGSSGNPGSGTANTGGGGGGAGQDISSTIYGGAGGSGVVIISYPGSTQQMQGGNVTIVGGNVIHTFTSSGYLTPLTNFNNSLRFRSSNSAYLSRTPTTTGNRQKYTISAWVKRGALSAGTRQELFAAGPDTNNNTLLAWNSDDTIRFFNQSAGSLSMNKITSAVYRDPAAWYHIVFAVDTTQSTSSYRNRLYINGSEVTSFSTNTDATQNENQQFNTASVASTIGRYTPSSLEYFDGYMTEVNFIDGQQLTPYSFGGFNSYGSWSPVRYAGSYGTNGFYLPFNVDKTQYSYAFNTTPSYLTSSTAGIMPLGNTTWSIECWTWCNAVPTSNVSLIANTATGGVQIFYRPAINTMEIGAYGAADVAPASVTVNNLLLNTWNHFVFTSNGTQLRIFANGILIGYTSSSYSFAASQGTVYIGTNDTTSSQTLNGFISNLRVCNGSIPTTYQTSSTTINAQVFTPPTSPLTTTSQGAANVTLLTCQSATIVDNSASPKTLAMTGTVTPSNINFNSNPFYDQGPAGNNWTPNNISLVNGSTCDSMTDVPTLTSATVANYCVINPLDTGGSTLTNGNLTQTTPSSGYGAMRSTLAVSSGKWYWEITPSSLTAGAQIGICSPTESISSSTQLYTLATAYTYWQNGDKGSNGSSSAYGASYVANDVIGIALDLTGGTITFYKNNSSQGTAYTGLSGTFTPAICDNSGSSASAFNVNFGQQPFVYTPPTGYVGLNTYNM